MFLAAWRFLCARLFTCKWSSAVARRPTPKFRAAGAGRSAPRCKDQLTTVQIKPLILNPFRCASAEQGRTRSRTNTNQMTQKPVLRPEGECVCVAQMARAKIRGRGWPSSSQRARLFLVSGGVVISWFPGTQESGPALMTPRQIIRVGARMRWQFRISGWKCGKSGEKVAYKTSPTTLVHRPCVLRPLAPTRSSKTHPPGSRHGRLYTGVRTKVKWIHSFHGKPANRRFVEKQHVKKIRRGAAKRLRA
jgi:hypothetical protein